MARYKDPNRPPRNTAPTWKKIAVVLSAPVAVFLVMRLFHINEWNFFLFLVVVLAVAAAAVWGSAKALGVHLSLGSWDEVRRADVGEYFGTDGIRGVAGELLTPEFAVQVGRAAAVVLAQKAGPHPLFVIGRDTRLSGPMLEAALTAGLTSGGARVEVAGVIPTPGLAALVHQRGADAGVVISASHNPFADNGIKFFSSAGTKLSDEEEAEIEAHIQHHDLQSLAGADFGSAEQLEGAVEGYVWDVVKRIPLDLSGMKIATRLRARRHAPGRAAGARGVRRARDGALRPAGRHQHQRRLRQHAHRRAAEGRGRRRLRPRPGLRRRRRPRARRRRGGEPGGRRLHHRHPREAPEGPGQAPRRHRRHHGHDQPGLPPRHGARGHPGASSPPVGDRYVVAEMLKGDYLLGGEQSGHIINRDVSTTGDGLATSLLLLQALRQMDVPLAEAATVMERLPQRLVNVRVRDVAELEGAGAVWAAVEQETRRLDGTGRVLVRKSGTEPLVRVMAEAPTQDDVDAACDRIVAVVEEHLT